MPADDLAHKAWLERSSFILGEYADEHDATLEGFGRQRPIEHGTVRGFLADHDRRRRAEGHTMHSDGAVGVPLPDGAQSVFVALPETVALVSAAQRIASDLDCDPGLVVSFLLTGKAFALPWIDVETLDRDLGPAFVLHVGSADVTAEDVRQAYVKAVRAALGADESRPLPSHIVPLILREAAGRRAGLKWAERWKAWQQFAREWSITGRARGRGAGDERTGYKTVESYRNYINKKKAQHPWIRRALEEADAERAFRQQELETADWQREFRKHEEGGSA
jgi:hypothetical protein